MRKACVLLFVTLLVAGLAIMPAEAGGSGHSHHESSTSPVGILLLLSGAIAFGVAAAGRRRRSAALVVLAVLVAVFGFESAVHSAHHLTDPQGAASCALFAASQHDESAGAPAVVTVAVAQTIEPSPSREITEIHPLPAFRAHEDRAPPALPSA